jgi:hypothetical protein
MKAKEYFDYKSSGPAKAEYIFVKTEGKFEKLFQRDRLCGSDGELLIHLHDE